MHCRTLNGIDIRSLHQLMALYTQARDSVDPKSESAEPMAFLSMRFHDDMWIVLETKECMASEAEVLKQHGIPAVSSADVDTMARTQAGHGAAKGEIALT